jgi:hypothetical protein
MIVAVSNRKNELEPQSNKIECTLQLCPVIEFPETMKILMKSKYR